MSPGFFLLMGEKTMPRKSQHRNYQALDNLHLCIDSAR